MSRLTNVYGNSAKEAEANKPNTTNRENYPAYKMGWKKELVSTLMTNTFGNTFYVGQKGVIKESEKIHKQAIKADPMFYAKALVFARTQGYMRSQPIYGLSLLCKADPKLFEAIFDQVILTPSDLKDFIALRGKSGHGWKRVASKWLTQKMSQYWAIKYGSKSNKDDYALYDILNVVHPVVPGGSDLFAYILGKDYNAEVLPQVAQFKRLKAASTDEEKIAAITEGRLPHEVTTPFVGKSKKVWEALIPQMPVMALLRNLATAERHDAASANKKFIQKTFSNSEIIAKSKILPFRFLEAEKHVKEMWIKDALRDALELSFANIPDIEGNTCVMLDISGSMGAGYGHPEVLPQAAIFAVALMKKADNGRLLLFDTSVVEMSISKRDSLLTQAQKIRPRGGTDTSAPFELITGNGEKYDNIILITDEQQNTGAPAYRSFEKYKKSVKNPNVKLFIIDVNNYKSALFNPKDDNVFYCFGWSDKVLEYIAVTSKDDSMIGKIESAPLIPEKGKRD